MEVSDYDQEHLESVLKDGDHDDAPMSSTNVPCRRPLNMRGEETNTTKDRYSLLPDYVQESFVKTGESKLEPSDAQTTLSFQDLRQDVEPNLPKNIIVVGTNLRFFT